MTEAPDIKIETAALADLFPLRALERLCFGSEAWPLLDLFAVLTFPDIVRLKAVVEGHMIGFVAGELRNKRKVGWVVTIGVHPDYRRKGIGKALLKECEIQLATSLIKLSVRRSNQSAIQMYAQDGYIFVETWPKYYEDGEDALVLQKSR